MTLSILVVTAAEPYAARFVDEVERLADDLAAEFVEFDAPGVGAIEYVLDDALAQCSGDYVLRIDDDERCSEPMVEWLHEGAYEAFDVWSFPRANLYPDERSAIRTAPLWPDLQTRLTVRAKSGGRLAIHDGCPYGPGVVAPVALEHWKFVVRSLAARERLVERYETLQPGAGSRFEVFSVPERFSHLQLAPWPSEVLAA